MDTPATSRRSGTASAGVAETPEANAALAQSREAAPAPTGRPAAGRPCAEGTDYRIGREVARAGRAEAYQRSAGDPVYRPLRIYALDPSGARSHGTIAVVNVPYEPVTPGPVGALFEVKDEPDGSGAAALDLDEPGVLIAQGVKPSPSDPRFRQQMVYAVCTTTYAAFRQALGRDLCWGFDSGRAGDGPARLRIRSDIPGLRNAYYDKLRGELRFGSYQAAGVVQGRNIPGQHVFTALSHDVVVHETAHALLDGLRSHFLLPTNPDVLAFHEAFADLVALMQRFTYRDVVLAGLRQAHGNLREAPLLTEIAKQIGQTIGMALSLRDAVNGTKIRYGGTTEPHELCNVLVAAVFEAFATVYATKCEKFIKLATNGTGKLPEGELPDTLAELLSKTASKLASQFLSVCIRAIDYCPPVDITFGEYLRAVITADCELVPDDHLGYREAWMDAFRKYEIYPRDVSNLAEDTLLWQGPEQPIPAEPALGYAVIEFDGDPGHAAGARELRRQARVFGALVARRAYLGLFGLVEDGDPALDGDRVDLPVVHSVRSARRTGPDGQIVFDLVAEVTQRRSVAATREHPAFDFYGGATVILDARGSVRYVIRKAVTNDQRMWRQRDYMSKTPAFWGMGPFGKLYCEPQPLRLCHELRLDRSEQAEGQ